MMPEWEALLPHEFSSLVVRPVAFEHHAEPSANAEKIIGLDRHGDRCFYCHSFMVTEEGFDVDEFPILIDVYYERVVAWKLRDGAWVRIKTVSDRLDRCTGRLKTLPAEIVVTP